jgi:predicted ATPase
MARLDRLSTVKEIAQLASVIGRGFSFQLLLAVSEIDSATLRRELQKLVDAELIHEYQNDKGELAFRFRHALIQDAAYESLLKNRKQKVHRAIAQAIVSQFPETADTQPEILAAHYVAAGLTEPAIAYWIQAGQRALVRTANHEAIANYQKALDLLANAPESPERMARELTVQASMGLALIATRGFGSSDVGLCFSRAENLCRALGDSAQLFPVLWGLWVFYLVRGELQIAQERSEHLLHLGESTNDLGMRIEGHFTLGDTLFWRGDFGESRQHLEQVVNLYSFEDHGTHAVMFGQDPGVSGLSYLSFTLWVLGYPEQALERSRQARELAERRGHPFSTAWALGCSALLNHFRGDPAETLRHAKETIAHSNQQGQPFWISAGTFLQGWAKFKMENRVEGLAEMRYGLAYYQAIGSQVVQPHFMGALAETLGEVGELDEALELLVRALEKARTHGERASEIDLHRIHANLLMAASEKNLPEAISALQIGVRMATALGARTRLLRSLVELYRLTEDFQWADQLRSVLDSFDEGHTEPAFVRARARLSVSRRKA